MPGPNVIKFSGFYCICTFLLLYKTPKGSSINYISRILTIMVNYLQRHSKITIEKEAILQL